MRATEETFLHFMRIAFIARSVSGRGPRCTFLSSTKLLTKGHPVYVRGGDGALLSVIAADRAVRSKTAYHFWLDQTWVIRNGRSSPLYRGYCSLYSKSVTLVKAGTSLTHLQVLCRYPAEGFVTRITKNIVSASFPQKLMWLYFFIKFHADTIFRRAWIIRVGMPFMKLAI
jgi:hypothetical protein